ncbi:MAG: hypothetical protein IKW01_05250, partial [Firmicutes bacterium]|nr:hypothetical protein [Bacillota bacterium]
MKQGKKFSRLLSLLLAVVMMIIMMPATAWAGEENGAVTVGFMAVDCLDGEIEYMRKELTVTPGLAKQYLGGEYGVTQYTSFEVGENDVTPVDVLVAAHIEEYGETFTNSPLGYIRGDGLGYVTKMFGSESEITYTANGIMPYTTTDDFGNTGYAINQYIVQEDDEITFYRMNYYSVPANVYASFDEVEAEIGVGENLTLKLGYYNAMDYTTEPYPAANAEIWTLDENGNFVKQLESTKTNANGEVTISFDTTGTYYLTCKGNITYMADNDWDGIEEETAGALSPAYCKVTVTGGETQNTAPAIKGEASATVAREAGSAYELDLSTIFEDADGDALTYYAKVGEGEYSQVEDGNYSYTPSAAGTYTLTFKANDGTADSAEYVVTLTVKSAGTDPTTVFSGNWFSNASVNITKVVLKGSSVIETSWNGNECEVTMSSNTPKDAEITFDISFAAGGQPQQWQGLWSALTVTLNDMTVAKPSSPNNAGTATVNLVNGKLDVVMAAATTGYSGTKTFKLKVEDGHVHDYGDWEKVDDNNHKKTCTSSEGDCLAPTITEAHKWDSGVEEAVTEGGVMVATKTTYTCGDCGATKVTQNASASILTVTVPSGAIPQIYRQDNYYKYTEYEALTSSENQNGTLTYYFSTDTKDGGTWSYRVSKEGSLTKAGYIAWGVKNLTVTYSENDIKPSERVDYTTAGTDNTTVAEDGVLLNINRQNFLTMDVNGTKTLKAYRAWELVQSYLNCIITPDFHYTIISGDDVVSLTDKDSPSAGDGDWKTLTALKEGTAIIEVTYDALQLEGGDYDGVYGASDPARTGLMVVQVGGKVADVDFGIQGKSSQSTSTSAMTYNSSYAKPWDAEFDTLYFTGSSGQLKLSPKVTGGTVSKVEVSADKGKTWTTLTAEAGVYTADIVSGNNIIKVTADTGVSYQIVRGDKISVKYIEVTDAATNPADGDGIIEAGETIRIKFNGIHQPIPKISGNYNPGYPSNDGGDMKIRLKYTFNNEAIKTENPLWQYNFITAGNYIDVVVPDGEETSYTLSDGYISVGVLGLPDFANDGADSHRNIPDDGCNTRGGKGDPTYNTRSMLPDLTITVGRATDTNTPPVVKPNAIKTKSIELGENFVINPETLFDDADGNTLAFTVSINGGDLQSADASFKYTPAAVGTYTINFTASDGKDQTEHTITLTVTEAPKEEEKKDDFGLLPKEIAGYVTISFEDNATRKAGEKGLKFPTALGTIVPTTKVPYKAGESIADVTLRLLDNCGIGYKTTYGQYGFYLSKIKNFKVGNTRYEEMGEFDAGNGSGWMITHNNVFIG